LAAEGNLLFNPGFELGSTEGWYPYGECTIEAVGTEAHKEVLAKAINEKITFDYTIDADLYKN